MVQKLTAFKFESMKKGPFYEVKVKIQNLKACISRAPAIFGTKTLWQSFHTILSNSWKNGWFCIIFRCFFALPKMVILLHKMEIVRILFLLSVRKLIYHPSSRSKSAQNVDLEKVFPPFWGFSTKTFFVTHGFRCSRFFVSPKISKQQEPPVCTTDQS